jgi:hypothetical protein
MNETHLVRIVKERLDAGLDLAPATQERLRAARERALDRHRVPVPALALETAGHPGGRGGWSILPGTRVALPIAVLVGGLAIAAYWHQAQQAAQDAARQLSEIEEIDAGLLTSDLPIDAYLDKGFDAWLKRSSE